MSGEKWPLWASVGVFVFSGAGILVFGVLMTRIAAELSRKTGMGEAILGALFVGVSTSLPEIAASTAAAAHGYSDLAVSNAVGSIAGQTAFLALADISYRKSNLEYSAASAANLMLAVFVIILLTILLVGVMFPRVSWSGVHPVSVLLVATYIYGLRLVYRTQDKPMWRPLHSRAQDMSEADTPGDVSPGMSMLWVRFAYTAGLTAGAGWLLARSAVEISAHSGVSETVVGGLFTGVTGSLPEMVSAFSAVRIGALTLAVGAILGSNAFDAVIVSIADVAHPGGSIFAGVGEGVQFLITLGILLTSIQLMGLVSRERHGIGNIGMESVLILVLYTGAFGLMMILD